MEISIQEFRTADVISIKGRIDSSTAGQVGLAVEDVSERGKYSVVIDLSQVEFISSAGLRVLVSARRSNARNNRGEITLAGIPTRIVSGLSRAFRIFDGVASALEYASSLAGDPITDTPAPETPGPE